MAGSRFARIEQGSNVDGSITNLIIANERDIWIIDAIQKTGKHSINPGPDFSIHNPILGPDSPDELFDFEFGREVEFLKQVGAKVMVPNEIAGRRCETWRFEAANYLVVVYVDAIKKSPIEMKAFKDGTLKFTVNYLSYESGLPFEAALFKPPKNVAVTESD